MDACDSIEIECLTEMAEMYRSEWGACGRYECVKSYIAELRNDSFQVTIGVLQAELQAAQESEALVIDQIGGQVGILQAVVEAQAAKIERLGVERDLLAAWARDAVKVIKMPGSGGISFLLCPWCGHHIHAEDCSRQLLLARLPPCTLW